MRTTKTLKVLQEESEEPEEGALAS
jgi:hypothetical protein